MWSKREDNYMSTYKKLNEQLMNIINEETTQILGYPVQQPTDQGMGIGNVVDVVPTGYYLGLKDAKRLAGSMSITVKPNELYYSFGTNTKGVFKFVIKEQIWKQALARPIDFNGYDYQGSVKVFLRNTKKLTPEEAKDLINNQNKLNNRSTFGDPDLQVGDIAITKDGLKGKVMDVFQDFAGQLFYRIQDPSIIRGYKDVFWGEVGLYKEAEKSQKSAKPMKDLSYDEFMKKFKNNKITIKLPPENDVLFEGDIKAFKRFLGEAQEELEEEPDFFTACDQLIIRLINYGWEVFVDDESLTDRVPEAYKIKNTL